MKKSKAKDAVKSLVKECLIEILAEGLVGNTKSTLKESRELRGALHEASDRLISENSLNNIASTSAFTSTSPKRPSYLDSITTGVDSRKDTETVNKKITETVSKLTNDPIMADILADTAMTTLREQSETAGRPSTPSVSASGDAAAKVVDQSLPEELFGGQSAKWANLAFAPSIR